MRGAAVNRVRPEPLWTPIDVAAYLGVPVQTFISGAARASGLRRVASVAIFGTSPTLSVCGSTRRRMFPHSEVAVVGGASALEEFWPANAPSRRPKPERDL